MRIHSHSLAVYFKESSGSVRACGQFDGWNHRGVSFSACAFDLLFCLLRHYPDLSAGPVSFPGALGDQYLRSVLPLFPDFSVRSSLVKKCDRFRLLRSDLSFPQFQEEKAVELDRVGYSMHQKLECAFEICKKYWPLHLPASFLFYGLLFNGFQYPSLPTHLPHLLPEHFADLYNDHHWPQGRSSYQCFLRHQA